MCIYCEDQPHCVCYDLDVFFEDELLFLVSGPELSIGITEDGCIEVALPLDVLKEFAVDFDDGDHIDNTKAGVVVRSLLS